MKKNPTGIRFNQEKLEFVQKMYPSLNTPQKVVTFLLNAFWWQHHAVVFKDGIAVVPGNSPIAEAMDALTEPAKPIKKVELRHKDGTVEDVTPKPEKKKISQISLLDKKDLQQFEGERLPTSIPEAMKMMQDNKPILSYQELLRLAPEQDTREKREEFLKEVTRNRKLSDAQKRAIHAKFPKPTL